MSKVAETKKEKKLPRSMTIGQYLDRFPKPEIDGLLRSLYSKKAASYEEWEQIIKDLVSKNVK
ncbi:hypothetical protein FACS189447_03340 [Spirochaetia bacterium]|nr:hypothetical protein FACS189447_03340 [Spirochaetia bacterium]